MSLFEGFFSSFSLSDVLSDMEKNINDAFDIFKTDDDVFVDATESPMDIGLEAEAENEKPKKDSFQIELDFNKSSKTTSNAILGNDIFDTSGLNKVIQKILAGQEISAMDFLE